MDQQHPDYETMCARKTRHESRRAARIEATQKAQATGRRHDVFGCPLCHGFHAKVELSPQKKRRLNARRNRRPTYALEA